MATRRQRFAEGEESARRRGRKKPALLRSGSEPTHADPRALQSGQVSHGAVRSLQRAMGNQAVSEMIVQREAPREEEEQAAAPLSGPIPTPYPSLSDTGSSGGTTAKVKMMDKGAFQGNSTTGRSQGDEAGTMKGMVSETTPPYRTRRPKEEEK
jgi:hypothetical protein